MEEIDLKELFQLFWEKKVQIILIIAIFAIIGVIYTIAFVTPNYKAQTTLLLATNMSSSDTTTSSSGITTNDVTLNSKLVATYSEIAKSSNVIKKVLSNLAIDESQEDTIKSNLSVTADSDANVITITVKNEDPVMAQKIANELAKIFIEDVIERYGMENLQILDEAEVNYTPYNVNHLKDIIVFTAIGVVIAVAYVLLVNMLDTTIKSAEDIEKATDSIVLVSIPFYEMEDDRNRNKKKGGRR